jgi:hypothetical protein
MMSSMLASPPGGCWLASRLGKYWKGLTWSFGAVHVECEFGVPDEGLGLSRGRGGSLQDIFGHFSTGETTALVEEKCVKGTDCEDLGMPVVDGDAVCFRELGGRKTFHAGSGENIRFWSNVPSREKHTLMLDISKNLTLENSQQ